jgi:hypothetical protein
LAGPLLLDEQRHDGVDLFARHVADVGEGCQPERLRPQRQIHETGGRIIEEPDLSLVVLVEEDGPRLGIFLADHLTVVAEGIDVVIQRQHRNLLGGVAQERAVGLHVQQAHRGVTGADLGVLVDLALCRQGGEVRELREPRHVYRLADARTPDDLDRVEPLVVEIPGLRLRDGDLLRGEAVLDIPLQGDAQVLLGLRLDGVEQRDPGADDAQGRPLQERGSREARRLRDGGNTRLGTHDPRTEGRRPERRRPRDEAAPGQGGLRRVHDRLIRGCVR